MAQGRSSGDGVRGLGRRDWAAFVLIAVFFCGAALLLALESMRCPKGYAECSLLAVAHWFDPVFFQYNLLMVTLAVLMVPSVTVAYLSTMAGRKERRLLRETPAATHDEIRARMRKRYTFHQYAGSVTLNAVVVMMGASIILLMKPVPGPWISGVDFSRGANFLLAGPFAEWLVANPQGYYTRVTRSLTAFQFGFLGAYVYFIGSLARAYFTIDLTPHTFVDGAIRMVGASVLALVLSFAPGIYGHPRGAPATAPSAAAPGAAGSSTPGVPAPDAAVPTPPGGPVAWTESAPWRMSLLPLVSFFFGFFPRRALLALERVALGAVRVLARERYRALPTAMLPGMSYAHELRFEREGIDNAENLSHSDPLDLAVRTGFGYRQLVQWVDDAWLCTRLREDYPAFVRATGLSGRGDLEAWFRLRRANGADPAAEVAGVWPEAERRATIGAKVAIIAALAEASPPRRRPQLALAGAEE